MGKKTSSAISLESISKSFRDGKDTVKALESIELTVKEGEIFGLLGPNGAGKTTLISILAGILSPDTGRALVFGTDCTRETQKVQGMINLVSGFSGVIYNLSLEEALMYYAMLYNVPEAKKKIDLVIKQVDLDQARGREASDMSSGMKQRYLIAKGLLNDPKLLILDEPTVGLDVESAINIRSIVKDLRTEGRTILLTTHNMFEAEELCDRIAFINHGKILAIGTAAELKGKVVSKRVIEIQCTKEQCVIDALSGIKGVSASLKSKNIVNIAVDSYTKMKDVLKMLSGCDSDIYGVNELEPTLEETYLQFMAGPGERGNGKKRKGGKEGAAPMKAEKTGGEAD
jgi:ABC-2 type transport system ATP-binding protein